MAKYLFETEPLNPVSLETELGLNRGDITNVIIYPSGAVEVEDIFPESALAKDKIKTALAKKGLPKGKKSDRG